MPPDFNKPAEFVEGVGEPTNACLLTNSNVDLTGWFRILSFLYFILILL
jgi:hypothetical protein